jgi:hypothetical protein
MSGSSGWARLAALVVLGSLALTGCARMAKLWPWGATPQVAPQAVSEIVVESASGAAVTIPQYWSRNTLVLDMQSVAGSGAVVLRAREGATWPVRLAFRVTPGQFGALDVRGDQRAYYPIGTEGAAPLELLLSPSIYGKATPEIRVSWGPTAAPLVPQ